MAKLKAKINIRHNGKLHLKGSTTLELTDETKHLVETGYAAVVGDEEAQNESSKPGIDDQVALVAQAIEQLDPKNQDLWTASDEPKCDALTAIVGFEVNAALRKSALQIVSGEE